MYFTGANPHQLVPNSEILINIYVNRHLLYQTSYFIHETPHHCFTRSSQLRGASSQLALTVVTTPALIVTELLMTVTMILLCVTVQFNCT